MRVPAGFLSLGLLAMAVAGAPCQALPAMPAAQLVREVAYNELHDHATHGYWRYWVERHTSTGVRLEEQVETAEGPVTLLERADGRPLDAAGRGAEEARIRQLLSSPGEQARHREQYAEDENRIGRIVALLPDAFLYEYAGMEKGVVRLRFRPNPDYPAGSIEARIFHAMSGDLWVDARMKRLARLDGRVGENVVFGWGILGRLMSGGWFSMQRTQVGPNDWKTDRLEIHMSGRALLFKTIVRETSEVRSGFVPVPAGMSLAKGAALLEHSGYAPGQVTVAALALHR